MTNRQIQPPTEKGYNSVVVLSQNPGMLPPNKQLSFSFVAGKKLQTFIQIIPQHFVDSRPRLHILDMHAHVLLLSS